MLKHYQTVIVTAKILKTLIDHCHKRLITITLKFVASAGEKNYEAAQLMLKTVSSVFQDFGKVTTLTRHSL